jgi:hypothetical protein
MWQELNSLWQSVRDPAYAHLLLESLPLFGVGIGLVFLAISMVTGETKSRLLALTLICVSCASVWPYTDMLTRAIPRVIATKEATYAPLIREQAARRADFNWVYYLMTVVSALAILSGRSAKGKFLLFVTMIGAVGVFWLSLWLHKKECEVYHRNIVRYEPPKR